MAYRVNPAGEWLRARAAGSPPDLQARVRAHLDQAPAASDPAVQLGDAGLGALRATLASPGDRAAALDLLAADALVTLALLVRAETDPGSLGGFAVSLRRAGAGP